MLFKCYSKNKLYFDDNINKDTLNWASRDVTALLLIPVQPQHFKPAARRAKLRPSWGPSRPWGPRLLRRRPWQRQIRQQTTTAERTRTLFRRRRRELPSKRKYAVAAISQNRRAQIEKSCQAFCNRNFYWKRSSNTFSRLTRSHRSKSFWIAFNFRLKFASIKSLSVDRTLFKKLFFCFCLTFAV